MSDLPVDVIRSSRRTRTVQARVAEGRLRIHIPASFTESEEEEWVQRMTTRIRARRSSEEIDLAARARALADRLDLPTPTSIEWSARQNLRWGSCSPSGGAVRISSRLADMPGWVLDAVIVHELAHLAVPGHGEEFHELAGRYRLTERARGYLIARSETG
jgi:predicted metal-dependent hydrolase